MPDKLVAERTHNPEVLLLEEPGATCPVHSCGYLRSWIDELPASPRVSVCTSLESASFASPACIVARLSPRESFAGLYAMVRKRWAAVPFLAVFCSYWVGVDRVARCLNDGIDDFLRCPFRRDETIARLERLLAYSGSARHAGRDR